ncbi:MAG: hypothetical protein RL091_1242 [Verrucomicrobiota bacterium]|jgi:hypothetical protein
MNLTLTQLIPVLQLATGPVILISGVGLLLLSFTNRLGRLIDRARSLHRERLAKPNPKQLAVVEAQIALIDRRAGILRRAITMSGVTVLLVSVLILTLFFGALFKLEVGILIIALFSVALLTLIFAIIGFLREIKLSLQAVRMEIQD